MNSVVTRRSYYGHSRAHDMFQVIPLPRCAAQPPLNPDNPLVGLQKPECSGLGEMYLVRTQQGGEGRGRLIK